MDQRSYSEVTGFRKVLERVTYHRGRGMFPGKSCTRMLCVMVLILIVYFDQMQTRPLHLYTCIQSAQGNAHFSKGFMEGCAACVKLLLNLLQGFWGPAVFLSIDGFRISPFQLALQGFVR